MLVIDVPRCCFKPLPNWDILYKSSKSRVMKNEIGISPELKSFMDYHKIPTVYDLLSIDDYTLLEMIGFGWRMMKEVLGLRKIE
jgi:hypothetical protein